MDHGRRADEVDLSGVVPERRETVLRRIAALEEYSALPKRTWQDLVRLCEPLGLAPASFNRLWRVWRSSRDPRAMQGLTTARGLRNTGGDGDYVRRLLADLPRGPSIEQDVLSIERTAREQDVPVRSRSALRRLVRQLREEDAIPALADEPPGVVALDMVPIEMAVDRKGMAVLPLAILVLHPRSGTVLSALLSLEPPSAALAAAALARWLDGMPAVEKGIRVEVVLAPATRDVAWMDLFRTFARRGIDRRGPDGRRLPAGVLVAGAVGRQVLGFDVRPRMVHRAPEARRPLTRSARLAGPLSLAQAQVAVDERIVARAGPTLFVRDRARLAAEIRTIFGL